MTKTQFAEAVGRRLAAIEAELKQVYEIGQDCKWCWGLCQCDGDWSAEAAVRHLEEERAQLLALVEEPCNNVVAAEVAAEVSCGGEPL